LVGGTEGIGGKETSGGVMGKVTMLPQKNKKTQKTPRLLVRQTNASGFSPDVPDAAASMLAGGRKQSEKHGQKKKKKIKKKPMLSNVLCSILTGMFVGSKCKS